MSTTTAPLITIDDSTPYGYRRDPEVQRRFEGAARVLLEADGWSDPRRGGEGRLVADLALEGGGVKGIGLVGAILALSEAGYSFPRVAGTSAGAIAATLVGAIGRAGRPMTLLRQYMGSLKFAEFMPEGKVHAFLDHHGGKAGSLTADAAILSQRMGLYSGDYLERWLGPILRTDLGIHTFADLRLTLEDDPGMSLPPGHQYRVVVHTSDVTRAELVRLPWDYPLYGYQPDDRDVVEAVRASMSIPFFFEPVTFEARAADVSLSTPDGAAVVRHYDGGTVTWVDGGMLRNFPIDAFDRADGGAPRWPTIGIKLSSLQTRFARTDACQSAVAVGVHCLRTMMNEWDAYSVDAATAARTIFVDNGGLTATDFDLTPDQQDCLFLNGVSAATEFVLEMAASRGVPHTADEARQRVRTRQHGWRGRG